MIIIDVRTPEEFNEGHLEGAINVPADLFMRPHLPDELKHTPKEEHIIVYCKSGSRAISVHNALHRLGFTHVENGINQSQTEHYLRR
jgi:phage shock protein E